VEENTKSMVYIKKYKISGIHQVAYCVSFLNFSYVLDGVPRMRERPIGDLVVGLKQLGADVDCFLGTDCPPVRVKGIGGLPGGKVSYPMPHAKF
jgi:5-enolpyruvylshikimate-3-phosphate synthase